MPGRLLNLPRSSSSSATPGATPPLFQYPENTSSKRDRVRSGDSPVRTPAVSAMEHLKRHSLAALGKGKEKEKDSRKGSAHSTDRAKYTNTLDVAVESPPAIFYGNANQSTGALYAGQLQLTVVDPEITLSTYTMTMSAIITARKPVVKDCADCAATTTELKQWTFITTPKTYPTGTHSMPFSYLIPGHLPITTHGDLGRIQYFLDARATVQRSSNLTPTSPAETVITMRREVHITRAVKPLDEKTSLRIFPPTNLTAKVVHYPVIHPIGEFNVQMQLSGIMDKQKDIQTRWRLRKMNWRLEEAEKMVSPACNRHAHKVGGQGKGIGHEDVRTVGRDDLKSGWKTDLSDGTIEMEFVARPSGTQAPLCDVESPTGLSVTHSLVVELIIAEEWAPNKTPDRATPTGAARVLRMQFVLMVTDRSGMGISWDEEQPPMYEDVPASPPMYPADKSGLPSYPRGVAEPETMEMQRSHSQMLNYTGTPLSSPPAFEEEGDEFDGLSLGPSRLSHVVSGPSARASSSRGTTRHTSSSNLGRERVLSLEDFDTQTHHDRVEEEDLEPAASE